MIYLLVHSVYSYPDFSFEVNVWMESNKMRVNSYFE